MRESGSYVSRDEQERRYASLRAIMAAAGCSTTIVVGPAQIGGKRYFRYFTDWNLQSFGGYLLVGETREPTAVFRAWSQAYWSSRIQWVQDIVSDRDPIAVVLNHIEVNSESGRVGLVGTDYMSVSDHARLQAALGARLIDLTSLVDELTAVKSAEEQELLRQTGTIFDRAWRAVLGGARPGMREWELAALAGRELLAEGVSHSIILVGASSPDSPAACVGWPRDRRLTPQDMVQMSIEGPGPSGYCVEVGGTFTFGPPPRELVKQFAAQLRGMEAGVRLLAEGRTSGQIADAVDREFREAGFHTGYPGMHGIGLGIPEPPPIEKGNPRTLSPGNVVAMHPNAVSDDGVGTLTSRTYAVGATAPECLSGVPMDLVEL
jgi:Xaa-Pro aminopeptidase